MAGNTTGTTTRTQHTPALTAVHDTQPSPLSAPVANVLFVKGAAECVLDRCNRLLLPDGKVVNITKEARAAVDQCVESMAGGAVTWTPT